MTQTPVGRPGSHGTEATPARAASSFFLACFSGPDQGKRVALSEGYLLVGTSTECDILSDDGEVAVRHAILALEAGRASVQPVDAAPLFLDGHRVIDTTVLNPGQQLRIGRSLWRIETGPAGIGSLIRGLGDRISSAAGVEKIQGFSMGEMFSEVFKRRSDVEVEDYLVAGTQHTTPPLAAVDTNWPKPWAFARTFLFSVAAYFLLVAGFREFQNPYFVPGIIVVGSVAFPFAILMFFYEMNVVRNISVMLLLKLLVFGGIFALFTSLLFFRYTNLSSWMGAMSAGVVEESGKLVVLLFFVNRLRYRWTLNGLLIGVAVGTGFSVFETAGYVMVQGLFSTGGGTERMFDIITSRGWLNLLGDHSLWTGLVGAALWRVRGNQPFRIDMLTDARFLRVLVLVMALHMANNAPVDPPFYLKYLVIGFVAWVALLSFVQAGLREVREAQLAEAGAGR